MGDSNADIYEHLARAFKVSPKDPRLNVFLQGALDNGYDPMDFTDFVTGATKERPQVKSAEDVPDWLVKGGKRPADAPSPPAAEKPMWTRAPQSRDAMAAEMRQGILSRAKQEAKTGAGGTFVDNALNAATFGGLNRLRDATSPSDDVTGAFREAREESNAESPYAAGAGEFVGNVLPGGPGLLGVAAGRAVRLGKSAVDASRAARMAWGAAKGAGAAELAAPATSAIRRYVESGADPHRTQLDRGGEAAGAWWETAKNPVVPIIGGALGAGGAYMNNARAASPEYQTLARHGAEPTVRSPARGQVFEQEPVSRGIEHGEVTETGVGTASRHAAEQSLGILRAEKQQAGAAFGEGAAAKPPGGKHDITKYADELWRIINDEESAPGTRKKAYELLDEIERHRVLPDPTPSAREAAFGSDLEPTTLVEPAAEPSVPSRRPGDRYVAPEESVQKIKSKTKSMTKPAALKEDAQGHIISAAPKMTQALADETGYGSLNEQYAAAMARLRAAHRALGAGDVESVKPTDTAVAEKVAARIAARGRARETAGKYESPEQAEVFGQRPNLERLNDTAALLRARQKFELHWPGLGDLKHPIDYASHLGEAGKFRLAAPMLDAGAANAGSAAEGGYSGGGLIMQALKKQIEMDRERSEKLRAAHRGARP